MIVKQHRHRPWLATGLFIAILCSLLVGCGGGPREDLLVGTWKSSILGHPLTYTFQPGGGFTMSLRGETHAGTWRLNGRTLTISLPTTPNRLATLQVVSLDDRRVSLQPSGTSDALEFQRQ